MGDNFRSRCLATSLTVFMFFASSVMFTCLVWIVSFYSSWAFPRILELQIYCRVVGTDVFIYSSEQHRDPELLQKNSIRIRRFNHN